MKFTFLKLIIVSLFNQWVMADVPLCKDRGNYDIHFFLPSDTGKVFKVIDLSERDYVLITDKANALVKYKVSLNGGSLINDNNGNFIVTDGKLDDDGNLIPRLDNIDADPEIYAEIDFNSLSEGLFGFYKSKSEEILFFENWRCGFFSLDDIVKYQ